jgi:putative ABC transport system permease protein
VRTPLYVLMGAVLCLLLIGSANLANLLVARSMTRSQEFVVRAALGARKERLILQSIMELAPMVALGGVFGLLLSRWLLALLLPFLPANMPRLEGIRLDWQVLAVSVLFLLVTAVAAGVWPALKVMRWNLNLSLRESGRTTISSGGASRLRNALVVFQMAAVVVLLIVSTLLIRSFSTLRNVDPGFSSDNILTVHFALSDKYAANPQFGQYVKRILDRVSTIPGVESAGMTNRIPLSNQTQTGAQEFEGIAQPVLTDRRTASADYFKTMGMPLVEGRTFDETDVAGRPLVGIIDDKLAHQLWPNESAVGKRFRFSANEEWHEIVGVVGHVRHDGLGIDRRSQVYWSYHQRSQPRMALAVRTKQDPRLLTPSIVAAFREIDPDQPLYDVRPMDEVVERSVSPQWLNTALLSLFASISLVLATVGVYGVMSYAVGMRSREIGIRMALGSQRRQVIWMILRQGGLLALLGAAIGVGASLLLGQLLSALLYEIKPTDVFSFVVAAGVLLIVALAACLIPARRAASLDPLSVLRAE